MVVASDWSKKPGNQARFERMNDEQKSELKSSWHAVAAQNYANSKGAEGDPADLKHLGDGARQYIESKMEQFRKG